MITLKTLQNQDGYTFEEGVAILVMCGTPKGIIQHIQKTHNMGYLRCEIAKILRMPGMAHRIRMRYPDQEPALAPKTSQPEEKPAESPDENPEEKPAESPEEKPEEKPEEGPDENPEVKTMIDVRSDRATRYEDMPTEKAKQLWLKKQDKYRLMQQKHLQMRKVAEGEKHNEERAKLRAAVVKLDADIDKLWAQIDEEVAAASQK